MCFVELIGGEGDPAQRRGRGRAAGRQIGGHRQQGAAGEPWRRARGACREAQGRAQLRGRGRRRHPDREDLARGACRQCGGAHLRHSQRHLQLHPHAHGAREAVVRRLPEGGAAARLCRGRSDLRHRGPRHRAEARDPRESSRSAPGSIPTRSMSRASPRSPPPISMLPTSSATASSSSALRCRPSRVSSSACTRPWCPKDSRDRPGDGRHQCGDRRCRGHSRRSRWSVRAPAALATASAVVADIADIARGVRTAPFGRPSPQLDRQPRRRRCSATRAATTFACLRVDKPGTAATIAKRLAQQHISMESIVQRHRGPPGRRRSEAAAAGSCHLITYATTEDAVRKALAAVKRDQVISGEPQLIRIEKN